MSSPKFLQPWHFSHLSASALFNSSTFYSSFSPLISDSLMRDAAYAVIGHHYLFTLFTANMSVYPEFRAWRHLFPYRGFQCSRKLISIVYRPRPLPASRPARHVTKTLLVGGRQQLRIEERAASFRFFTFLLNKFNGRWRGAIMTI